MPAYIRLNQSELNNIARRLGHIKDGMALAVSRGINRTASSARTQISRQIADEVKIKRQAINRGLRVDKANRRKLHASIEISGKRIALAYFSPRQLKTAVSYQIGRKGGRGKISYDPNASFPKGNRVFKATMKTGHTGIFKRASNYRLDMLELYGPSIPGVFEGAYGLRDKVVKETNEKLTQNILTQVDVLIKQAERKK